MRLSFVTSNIGKIRTTNVVSTVRRVNKLSAQAVHRGSRRNQTDYFTLATRRITSRKDARMCEHLRLYVRRRLSCCASVHRQRLRACHQLHPCSAIGKSPSSSTFSSTTRPVRANHLFSIPVRSDCIVKAASGPGRPNISDGVTALIAVGSVGGSEGSVLPDHRPSP